jgi:hypothetical protein
MIRGLGWCSGSDPDAIPGSGRDAFAGLNMPLAPYGVLAGSLCIVVKPDSINTN